MVDAINKLSMFCISERDVKVSFAVPLVLLSTWFVTLPGHRDYQNSRVALALFFLSDSLFSV